MIVDESTRVSDVSSLPEFVKKYWKNFDILDIERQNLVTESFEREMKRMGYVFIPAIVCTAGRLVSFGSVKKEQLMLFGKGKEQLSLFGEGHE